VTAVPPRPSIFHITHVDNLASIVAGGLCSDAAVQKRTGIATVGMKKLKARRLLLPVTTHPGLKVGDCVPFYFCPRSVMLFLLHRGNHPEVSYTGGQDAIVHLEADLHEVVAWAESQGLRWAFSLGNAAAYATEFRADLADLGDIDWAAVANDDFRDVDVREAKQAEFLIEDRFGWSLVRRIGVRSAGTQSRALQAIARAAHRPPVEIKPSWYY